MANFLEKIILEIKDLGVLSDSALATLTRLYAMALNRAAFEETQCNHIPEESWKTLYREPSLQELIDLDIQELETAGYLEYENGKIILTKYNQNHPTGEQVSKKRRQERDRWKKWKYQSKL